MTRYDAGVRNASGAGVDARERMVEQDVVQRLLGGFVNVRESPLQEGDAQQHESRVRRTSRVPRLRERADIGDKDIPRGNGENLPGEPLPVYLPE